MTRQINSAAFIVNAKSRQGQRRFAEACSAMAGLPYPVDAHAVEDPGKLCEVLATALAKKPDLVIIGGGDGTVSGLVDQLVGHGVILGVMPFGTANSFARTLGIPLDPVGAIEVLKSGVPRRIDLGMIGDDYYCNCATLGIAPQIAASVPHGLKKVAGRLGYLTWAAWEFLHFKPFTLIVGEGASAERLRVVEVRISNGPYHGGTELVESAEIDSGEIVVQAVVGHIKRRLVVNWVSSVLRLPARHEQVREFRGKALKLATEPVLPISIDGELLATTPVTAKIAAGVIEVMVPAAQ
ncbi:diacylglycerol/lipid kinase family protein [Sphingomonas sp.]|uniref:diacylglycerol/lipid kinase family protein n=1 Tax=Sphingomonas sp. TaxID=28214 RepID=UPI003B004B68